MSTQSVTAEVSDPILSDDQPIITIDILCASLDSRRADYVRALDRRGMWEEAVSQANCMRYGKLSAECVHGHYAQGNRTRCHDPFCTIDGRRAYRLHPWLLTRSEGLLNETQTGIEIILPNEGPSPLLPTLHGNYDLLASRAKANRDRLLVLSTEFLRALGLSSVAHDVIAPNDSDTRVRVAVPGELQYTATLAILQALNPAARLELKRNQSSKDLLLWVFGGLEPALMLSGEYRVALRIAYKGAHLVRASGDFYARLSPAEIAERKRKHAEELAAGKLCPVCSDSLRMLPDDERVLEPVDDVESRYGRVSWNQEWANRGIVSKGGDRNNSPAGYRIVPTMYPVAASPPS